MDADPFMELCERLFEVQMELMCRAWTEDRFARIEQAGDLRQRLWAAIAAYRDSYVDLYRSY